MSEDNKTQKKQCFFRLQYVSSKDSSIDELFNSPSWMTVRLYRFLGEEELAKVEDFLDSIREVDIRWKEHDLLMDLMEDIVKQDI